MKLRTREEEAMLFLYRGHEHQMAGRLTAAIVNYKKSIEVHAMAEAHTFLGWTYSFMERFDQAIEECKKAIQLDPEFGNPYNDIGAYLIEKGCLDEAMSFLLRAMKAKNYENYCFPHYNAGRIWEERGDRERAIRSYRRSLRENPKYSPARLALRKLQGLYN
jgi:Tfp pilus assembly protein PilF